MKIIRKKLTNKEKITMKKIKIITEKNINVDVAVVIQQIINHNTIKQKRILNIFKKMNQINKFIELYRLILYIFTLYGIGLK